MSEALRHLVPFAFMAGAAYWGGVEGVIWHLWGAVGFALFHGLRYLSHPEPSDA